MKCPYLQVYQAASGAWRVHTCIAKTTPYVPSLAEITSYCSTSRCQGCLHGRRCREVAGPGLTHGGVCASV
jgi:hypothetical protein